MSHPMITSFFAHPLAAGVVLVTLALVGGGALAQPVNDKAVPASTEKVDSTELVAESAAAESIEGDEEPEVQLSEEVEVALEVLVDSSEDPEVERRERKQADRQARHEQQRAEAEQSADGVVEQEQRPDATDAAAVEPGSDEGEAASAEEAPPVGPAAPGADSTDPVATDEMPRETQYDFELYASARLHGISLHDPEQDTTSTELGDGASRIGAAAYIDTSNNWELYGRVEYGFNILDTFSSKAQFDSGATLPLRLAYIGVDSDYFNFKLGKSWSAYYKVSGAADLFSVFSSRAMGIYNADTDGGASGTGRADDAIQTQVYVDMGKWIDFKPFNVNLQYQWDQTIPKLDDEKYSDIYSVSTWLEHWADIGIGFAYHHGRLENEHAPEVRAAGIDGDLRASTVAIKGYGDKWLASLVLGSHDNLETTDLDQYVNAEAAELFIQRRVSDRIWLIGGGNWLLPDEDDPDAGDYKVAFGVLGARYTFDGLKRMVYVEWKEESSRRTDGTPLKNEITVGVRWDFSY